MLSEFSNNEDTDNCNRDIPELPLLKEQKYGMIPCTTFVWSFSFSSYIVPVILYNTKKVSHSNSHVESENQNTKGRMEMKNKMMLEG